MGPNISLQRTLRDTIYPLKPDKKSRSMHKFKTDPYPFYQWPLTALITAAGTARLAVSFHTF